MECAPSVAEGERRMLLGGIVLGQVAERSVSKTAARQQLFSPKGFL